MNAAKRKAVLAANNALRLAHFRREEARRERATIWNPPPLEFFSWLRRLEILDREFEMAAKAVADLARNFDQ